MKKLYFTLIFSLLLAIAVSGQTINFPDTAFKTRLLSGETTYDSANNLFNIDVNADGEIQLSEALLVSKIDMNSQWNAIVTDITGVENFTNLKILNLVEQNISAIDLTGLINLEECKIHVCNTVTLNSSNVPGLKSLAFIYNIATALDVSNNTSLTKLNVEHNQLTSIDISSLSNLKEFNCEFNNLTALDASGLSNLKEIMSGYNNLASINLTGLVSLQLLNCPYNQLTSIDLSGLPALNFFFFSHNQLTTLDLSFFNDVSSIDATYNLLTSVDFSGSSKLTNLFINNNLLTSLDVSKGNGLNNLEAKDNNLEYINIKNGKPEYILKLDNNPNLTYACIDDNEFPAVVQDYLSANFPNCVVNTYCSFVPGGIYYTIQGSFTYDADTNGCDNNDSLIPMQGILADSEFYTTYKISDASGNYTLDLPPNALVGGYTITPINPDPEYFQVSPESLYVEFPETPSPYNQVFCITPIGTFNDLEITLLPITPARPGFDAKYRLIYKNKGTTEQVMGIFLNYNGDLLEYVSSTIVPNTTDTGNLFWELDNIKPFEEGVIDVILNVNSPVETPPVNNDDILAITANIQNPTPEAVEHTPIDNVSELHQKVVGSLDPNDKTCVEGTTIHPDMAGEYVTYLIRFENTGTYHAENIVVKDEINAEKFDISTLKPLQSSHPYVTRIKDNSVEFIFENIMLPGTPSEDRHGFVAFKIKTKTTLQLNDTFSNSAAIYFDFNAPAITNEAVTTLGILGTDDFDFANNISVYPNPTTSILNIDVKDIVSLHSLEVYNIMGQRVLEIQNADNSISIDISRLATGTYILKAITDKGAAHTKFIKK